MTVSIGFDHTNHPGSWCKIFFHVFQVLFQRIQMDGGIDPTVFFHNLFSPVCSILTVHFLQLCFKTGKNICSFHGTSSFGRGGLIAGKPVKPYRKWCRLGRAHSLSKQSCNYPTQHITRTCGGHPIVPGQIQEKASVCGSNPGSRILHDQSTGAVVIKYIHKLLRMYFQITDRTLCQPAHFSEMRGQDAGSIALCLQIFSFCQKI